MSKKELDSHGRWRSVTVAFRVSPEESDHINTLVAMSGLSKQEYILRRLEGRDIKVVPSTRVQKALADEMHKVYVELLRLRRDMVIGDELEDTIQTLAKTFAALGTEAEASNADAVDLKISKLG